MIGRNGRSRNLFIALIFSHSKACYIHFLSSFSFSLCFQFPVFLSIHLSLSLFVCFFLSIHLSFSISHSSKIHSSFTLSLLINNEISKYFTIIETQTSKQWISYTNYLANQTERYYSNICDLNLFNEKEMLRLL